MSASQNRRVSVENWRSILVLFSMRYRGVIDIFRFLVHSCLRLKSGTVVRSAVVEVELIAFSKE